MFVEPYFKNYLFEKTLFEKTQNWNIKSFSQTHDKKTQKTLFIIYHYILGPYLTNSRNYSLHERCSAKDCQDRLFETRNVKKL